MTDLFTSQATELKEMRIVVPGCPVAKPRQTQRDRWMKRPCVMKYRAWADHARILVAQEGGIPNAESVNRVDILAIFEAPKSLAQHRRDEMFCMPHRNKPDVDNCAKAAIDALWIDDQKIPDIRVRKIWGYPERVEIAIWYLSSKR